MIIIKPDWLCTLTGAQHGKIADGGHITGKYGSEFCRILM